MIRPVNCPFPSEPAARKAAAQQMRAEAPALMADIDELRKQFPGSKLTFIETDGLSLGTPPTTAGWKVDDNLIRAAAAWRRRFALPPDVAEQKRKDKQATGARRRRNRT